MADDCVFISVERSVSYKNCRKGEEILARILLKRFDIPFKLIENIRYSFNEPINISGAFPYMYYKGYLIPYRNIPFLLKDIVSKEEPKGFSYMIYLLRDMLRPVTFRLNQVLNDKHDKNNNINSLVLNSISTCIINQYQIKDSMSEKESLLKSLYSIYEYIIEQYINSDIPSIMKITLYAYLKETSMLNEYLLIKSTELQTDKFRYINSFIENFNEEKHAISPIDLNNITDIFKKYTINLSAKALKSHKKIEEIQQETQLWHSIISISLFISISGLVWYISKDKKQSNST